MDELTQEFVLESSEGLDRMERCLAELRGRAELRNGAAAAERVAEVFRAVHTIKGTVGFLGFPRLEKLAHVGESLLTLVRSGQRAMDEAVIEGLVGLMDRLREVVQQIEATGADGDMQEDVELIDWMRRLADKEEAAEECGGGKPGSMAPKFMEYGTAGLQETTVRVGVDTLNRLMNLVGELVQTRNEAFAAANGDVEHFLRFGQRLDSVTADLRETVMRARMQPVEQLFQKFPRLAREVAASCGKKVRLEYSGAETGLDKGLIEVLKDPLTHAVRNAIDHGIETAAERRRAGKPVEGTVHLRAYHASGQVVVEVGDDGAGIDSEDVRRRAVERGLVRVGQARAMTEEEAIQLVFAPGFSTREDVTMISGRGVGMDVVRSNVEQAGGSVELLSVRGKGTTLRMRVPLTLAIVPAMIARCGEQFFAVPRSAVLEMVVVHAREEVAMVQRIGNAKMLLQRGRLLPLVELGTVLGIEARVANGFYVAVLEANGRQFGLVVDDLAEPQEIVVKPISPVLRESGVYSGAALLGSGVIAMILDAAGLARVANVRGAIEESVMEESADARAEVDDDGEGDPMERMAMLVFEDRCGERKALPLECVERIETVTWEAVEYVAGQAVMQYRAGLLVLHDASGLLNTWEHESAEQTRLAVICRSEGVEGKRFGVVVSAVLDVAEGERLPAMTLEGEDILLVSGKVTTLYAGMEWKRPDALIPDETTMMEAA